MKTSNLGPTTAQFVAFAMALAMTGSAAAPPPPDQTIREATEKLQSLIKQNRDEYKSNSAKFYKMVDEVVVPRFDTRHIGQLVLGRHWRAASEDQRKRFVAAFKHSLVYSYADALLEYYDTVKVDWKPARLPADARDTSVHSTITRQNGPPIELGFSVNLINGDWKIYDVVVDGISLASNFRTQFSAEIKQNGLDALIKRLESGGKPLQNNDSVKQQPEASKVNPTVLGV
jgi:phospholipid transport system substrate-binding protein